MGGGNGQKSKTKRDRNNAKKAKDTKLKNAVENKAKFEAAKQAIKCTVCMTTFMCTASMIALTEHFESKHSGKSFTIEQCFPHLKE